MKKVYKKFQTLSEIAKAKAMVDCDPSKPYFNDLLHYHEQELADRIQEDFIKETNNTILEEIIKSVINSHGISEEHKKYIETPGLRFGDEEITRVENNIVLKYVSYGKANLFWSEEKLMEVIEFFQSIDFLP